MIYHYKNGERVDGAHSDLRGDVSDLHGDVSDLRGDVSDIIGEVSDISGDVSDLRGDVSDISGDVSDLRGDVSDLRGDVSDLHGDVSDLRGDVSDISGNVIFVTNVGSRESATYYFYQCDVIICGCFRGNLEKFILRVQKKYPDGKYRKEYDAVIALFETIKETKK